MKHSCTLFFSLLSLCFVARSASNEPPKGDGKKETGSSSSNVSEYPITTNYRLWKHLQQEGSTSHSSFDVVDLRSEASAALKPAVSSPDQIPGTSSEVKSTLKKRTLSLNELANIDKQIPIDLCTDGYHSQSDPISLQPLEVGEMIYILKIDDEKLRKGEHVICISKNTMDFWLKRNTGEKFRDPVYRDEEGNILPPTEMKKVPLRSLQEDYIMLKVGPPSEPSLQDVTKVITINQVVDAKGGKEDAISSQPMKVGDMVFILKKDEGKVIQKAPVICFLAKALINQYLRRQRNQMFRDPYNRDDSGKVQQNPNLAPMLTTKDYVIYQIIETPQEPGSPKLHLDISKSGEDHVASFSNENQMVLSYFEMISIITAGLIFTCIFYHCQKVSYTHKEQEYTLL